MGTGSVSFTRFDRRQKARNWVELLSCLFSPLCNCIHPVQQKHTIYCQLRKMENKDNGMLFLKDCDGLESQKNEAGSGKNDEND